MQCLYASLPPYEAQIMVVIIAIIMSLPLAWRQTPLPCEASCWVAENSRYSLLALPVTWDGSKLHVQKHHLGFKSGASDARRGDKEEESLVAWRSRIGSIIRGWVGAVVDRPGLVMSSVWAARSVLREAGLVSALDWFCAVTLGAAPGCIALSQVPETSWPFVELAIIHLFSPSKEKHRFYI